MYNPNPVSILFQDEWINSLNFKDVISTSRILSSLKYVVCRMMITSPNCDCNVKQHKDKNDKHREKIS